MIKLNCPYCSKDLRPFDDYYLCKNPKCYFFNVPRLYFDNEFIPKVSEKVKPKTKMQQVIETGKNVFKDIKTEMSKTMSETGEALKENMNVVNSAQNVDSNKDKKEYYPEDVFDTQFGRMDAGGL